MSELATQGEVKAARQVTERIRLSAANAREALEKLPRLIEEAKTLRADELLGYASWTAYLSAVFGEEPLRLPRDQRQELVGYLSGEGMSTRAIAPIVGASHVQVKRDVDAGVTYVTPEAAPAPAATVATGEGVVIAEQRHVDLVTGEVRIQPTTLRASDYPEIADRFRDNVVAVGASIDDLRPVPRKVTGLDGKTYSRPTPGNPLPVTAASRQREAERQQAMGWRDTCRHIAEAVYTITGGERYARIFLREFYPHESDYISDSMRLSRERIDSAIEFLTTIRDEVTQ